MTLTKPIAAAVACPVVSTGDILFILPVHSCLTVNLFKEYVRLDGQRIPTIAVGPGATLLRRYHHVR